MSEAKPQDGYAVQGDRKLTDEDIANMNRLKDISRQFLMQLAYLDDGEHDRRWLNIARTEMQKTCMFACRAVAQPEDDC